ncbi:hypothetical protein ADUPG1_000137, partial [Aduncisulcus paluster]
MSEKEELIDKKQDVSDDIQSESVSENEKETPSNKKPEPRAPEEPIRRNPMKMSGRGWFNLISSIALIVLCISTVLQVFYMNVNLNGSVESLTRLSSPKMPLIRDVSEIRALVLTTNFDEEDECFTHVTDAADDAETSHHSLVQYLSKLQIPNSLLLIDHKDVSKVTFDLLDLYDVVIFDIVEHFGDWIVEYMDENERHNLSVALLHYQDQGGSIIFTHDVLTRTFVPLTPTMRYSGYWNVGKQQGREHKTKNEQGEEIVDYIEIPEISGLTAFADH